MRVNRMLLLPAVPAKTGYTGFRLSSCWPRMALAAGLLLCWLHGAARAEGTQDVSALVETGAVQHTEMQGTVSGYGAVVPAPGAMLNLNFAMAGTVTRVRVTPGQRVTRGMTLLEANATPQTELAQRQAAHAVAYAQGELARVQALFAQQLATRSQLAAAQRGLKDAKITQRAQRNGGPGVRGNRLLAPFGGTVASVAVAPGDTFAGGAALLQLVRTGTTGTGVVISVYRPAGALKTGSFTLEERAKKRQSRRS